MNVKIVERRRKVRRLIEINSLRNRNHICPHSGFESESHVDMKIFLGKWGWFHKESYYQEVRFVKSNKIADHVWESWGVVVEVLDSETEASLREKQRVYPLPVIGVRATCELEKVRKMLEDLRTCEGSNAEYYTRKILE